MTTCSRATSGGDVHPPHGKTYRSVFISDVHLCARDAQSERLYEFLDGLRCDYLYLVGDVIDVWALRKKWYWPRQYNDVVHKLLKRSRKGAKVILIPGNHDDFFRDFLGTRFGDIEVRAHDYHTTADGRRFLVIHGDQFDTVVRYHRWLSVLSCWAYQYLITLNRLVNAVRRRLGKPYWSLAGAVKQRVKRAVKFISDFETTLIAEAKRQNVAGVICGHIHQPDLRRTDGILYLNTGDWVEHCTAIVEDETGRLSLITWPENAKATGARTLRFEAPADAETQEGVIDMTLDTPGADPGRKTGGARGPRRPAPAHAS